MQKWAELELQQADLGDARRNKRLTKNSGVRSQESEGRKNRTKNRRISCTNDSESRGLNPHPSTRCL
ncbi:transposase DNA-binding-containing protein [Brasilonema bromeliae]|uniref:Transposase Tn5-like N-terminal domain-containing protein n=1 Tax=Brasilonema bromeliae SPC951 TaxID=385972 RepID=A0ABX1PBC6_9CYAN|nr:hypothetical protein [Brasilonema bromeliae SPC951]